MMSNVEPEEILELDFTPGIDIGFVPQEPSWGTASLMKMGFLPKQGTSFLPYDPEDLGVKGETPPEAISPPSPGKAGSTPPGTPPSTLPGTVRAHKPSLAAVSRISPKSYLKHGIRCRLYLDAAAEVNAHVEAKYRLAGRKAKEREISKTASRKLAAGFYEITLKPDAAAKVALAQHKTLKAEVIVKIAYDDRTTTKLEHRFRIAMPPTKHEQAAKAKKTADLHS